MKIESQYAVMAFSSNSQSEVAQSTTLPVQAATAQNPNEDRVTISVQAYQAFSDDQRNKTYQPGDVMKVADNRERNYQKVSQDAFLQKISQSILDQRTGLDREKLEELEAKMKEIADNPNLTDQQKEDMLAALEEERMALIEEAAKRREEAERREEFQGENKQA